MKNEQPDIGQLEGRHAAVDVVSVVSSGCLAVQGARAPVIVMDGGLV